MYKLIILFLILFQVSKINAEEQKSDAQKLLDESRCTISTDKNGDNKSNCTPATKKTDEKELKNKSDLKNKTIQPEEDAD